MKTDKSMLKFFIFRLMAVVLFSCTQNARKTQPELGTRSVEIIKAGNLQFKDLNKNGKLDKYED
jgi:beta-glucosidase